MAIRSQSSQTSHDKAVKIIAEKRFDNIKYDVRTNPDGEKNAHIGKDTDNIYPDIIVLEKGYGSRTVIAIGEVETADSINDEEAKQWMVYSKTNAPFILYVPLGYENQALEIIRRKSIAIAGLRVYFYSETDGLVVTNILMDEKSIS